MTLKEIVEYEDAPKPTALVDQHYAHVAALTEKLKHADFSRRLGGPGSGHFGHTGRPGEVGGSSTGTPQTAVEADALISKSSGISRHNVYVYNHPLALQAAPIVANTVGEMRRKGYAMPDAITVDAAGEPSGQTLIPMLGRRAAVVSMTINVPLAAPPEMPLDLLAFTAFGEDNQYVVRTYEDIVIHEMGHVQMGEASGYRPSPSELAIMRKVSHYAETNADEFLAEAFTRQYRGETLDDDVLALYTAMKGPKIR